EASWRDEEQRYRLEGSFYHPPARTRGTMDQPVFVETAFERAVEERRSPARPKADQLRQARVAAQQKGGPPGEALLERIAQPRIERRECLRGREPHAVGRIGDDHARRRGSLPTQHVGLLDGHGASRACRVEIGAALRDRARVAVAGV